MSSKVIFHKGRVGKNSDWDDTALIKAYDEAVNSFKEKLNSDAASETSNHGKKNEKKSKKVFQASCDSQWKVGDKCLAKFSEDGLLYEATILSVDTLEKMCQVKYSYYDNEESIMLDDLHVINDDNSLDMTCHSNVLSEAESNSSTARKHARCHSRSSLSSAATGSRHNSFSSLHNNHLPNMPPPPLPDLSSITNENDALHGMLISWYMSGYYTGYYKGLQNASRKK